MTLPVTLPFGRRAAGAAAVGVCAALLAAGCAHDEAPPPPTVVTAPPTTSVITPAPGTTVTTSGPDTKINTNAGPGASTGTDTALADAVNTAIVHNKQMTGSRVEPVAVGGVVTLTGQVQNQQQKALAEKSASQVPGVVSVKNKLLIVSTGGAKPQPTVITKTNTIVIHDKSAPEASPADTGSGETGSGNMTPPPPPSAPNMSAPPTATGAP